MADKLLLQRLASAWTEADPEGGEASSDETGSPRISEMIRRARRYLIGNLSTEELLTHLRELQSLLHQTMAVHYRRLGELALGPQHREAGQRATRAFEDFSIGLARMIRGLIEHNPRSVDDGLALCKRSSQPLEEWLESLQLAEMDEQPLVCACGWVAVADRPVCPNCGEPFPDVPGPEHVPHYVAMPAELAKLFDSLCGGLPGELVAPPGEEEPWVAITELLLEDFEQARRVLGGASALSGERPELMTALAELDASLQRTVTILVELLSKRREELFDFFGEAWYQMMLSVRNARAQATGIHRALLACLPPTEGMGISEGSS